MSWADSHCLPGHDPPTKADSGARSSRHQRWVGCVFVLIGVTAGTEPGDAAAEDINKHVPCSFGLCDQELPSSVESLHPPTPIP